MVQLNNALAGMILGAGAIVAAAPAAPTTTAAPDLKDAQIGRRADSCTFTDAAAASASKASCSTIILSDIAVPAGETLDLTNLANNTYVEFQGTTSFEYKEWTGPLISFSGTGITITGAEGHLIDGNGAKWWDTKGTNGGKDKPKFFYAHKLLSSTIKGLNVKNTPVQGFSINGAKELYVQDITIDNTDGDATNSDGDKLGHNTDAFDVGSSTGVYISGANIQNQDDCLAVNSGESISFTGGTCSGGHGISIGSVGGRSNNDVKNVTISDNTVTNSDNGIRIKTVFNTTGSVADITYSDITLDNIAKYGIVIEQDYENGSPTGEPSAGVPITGVSVSGVSGTVADDATQVYILCASCSEWTAWDVSITGGKPSDDCVGVPAPAAC